MGFELLGYKRTLLILSAGGNRTQQFLLFYLVCIEGWVLMWLLMSIWALWFSSSKIDPGMLLVDDKTSDKTFLMMFLGEYLAAWDTWEQFLSSGVGLALWKFTVRSGGYRWDISKIVLFMSHFRKFGWILYKSFLNKFYLQYLVYSTACLLQSQAPKWK